MKVAPRRLILIVAGVCLLGSHPVLAQQNDPVGVYRCQGTGAAGETYEGYVEIIKNDDAFLVRWIIPPRDFYIGVGVMQGDSLAVSYGGAMLGLVVYKIETDTRLVGHWTTVTAKGHLFSETLTKVDPSEILNPEPEPPGATAPEPAPEPNPLPEPVDVRAM